MREKTISQPRNTEEIEALVQALISANVELSNCREAIRGVNVILEVLAGRAVAEEIHTPLASIMAILDKELSATTCEVFNAQSALLSACGVRY